VADKFYIFTGTDYTTVELELALDVDNIQALVPGTAFVTPDHENTWHSSPWGDGSQLVRHKKSNRIWPVSLLVGEKDGSTPANTLGDTLALFERLADQARTYESGENVDKVGLCLQLDGATKRTYYNIKDIICNGSSLMNTISRKRGDAEMQFEIITQPWGYSDEETLCNWVRTPHFQEGAAGLGSFWNLVSTPTPTFDTTVYLCGTQSQRLVTAAAGSQGIVSDAIVCTGYGGMSFVSYVWVIVVSGDDITYSVIGNNSGSLGTATYGAATTTTEDSLGNTWSRMDVSGTIGVADTSLTVRIERLTGDASAATTFRVDKAYLQVFPTGSPAIPTAWSSYYQADNHYNVASEKINYIDVVDVPGDMRAETKYKALLSAAGAGTKVYIGLDPGPLRANSYFYDDQDGTADPSGDSSGGEYYTQTGITTTWGDLGGAHTDPSPNNSRYNRKYILFARIQNASVNPIYVRSKVQKGSDSPFVYGQPVLVAETQDWAVQQVGIVDLSNPEYDEVTSWDYISWDVQAKHTGTGSIFIDFSMIFPIRFCILSPTQVYVYLSSLANRAYYTGVSGISGEAELLGQIPELDPGESNRIYFIQRAADTNTANNYWPVNGWIRFNGITYTPRTSTLFGS